MNINDVTARKEYVGNGSTTIFAYDFGIVSTSDIEVIVGGVVQTLGTHYSVSGAGVDSGGNVTFVVAPSNAVNVILLRKQPFAQPSVYQANEDFPAKRLETDLSKIVMLTQQIREIMRRVPTLNKSSLLSNIILNDGVAGKFLRYTASNVIDPADVASTTGLIGIPVSPTQGGTGSDNFTGLTKAAMLALSPAAGRLIRITDAERGWYGSNGVTWGSITNERINVKADFNAKGDGKVVSDAGITIGLNVLTSATANFVVTDVGKTVVVLGAGVAGAPFITTILGFTNSTTVTTTANASTTVSNARCFWGTNDSVAFQAALDASQIRGASLEIPPPDGAFYVLTTGLTYAISAISYAPVMIGVGKYSSVIFYTGSGSFLSPVATTGFILGGHVERLQIQLCQVAAVGIDAAGLTQATFRSLSFYWKGSGSQGGTGIKSSPTATQQVSFFNVVDDVESNSMAVHTLLDNPNNAVGAPNRWRFVVPSILAPNAANTVEGIKIGISAGGGSNIVSGTQIIGINCDQQGGGGIVLGAKADRTEITNAFSETAQGGALFNVNDLANRTTVLNVKVPAGAFFVGATLLGIRAMYLADWDGGLLWSGATSTALIGVFRASDGGLVFNCGSDVLTYGANVAVDMSKGDYKTLIVTSAGAYNISNSTNGVDGQICEIAIFNNSGGAITTTFGANYHLAGAWVDPANARVRIISFRRSFGIFYEKSRSTADVIT